MKHPDREALIGYLYDEAPAAERAGLEAHLRECPACRAQLGSWKAVGSALSSLPDPLPARAPARPRFQPAWLAAAAALIALGMLAGRLLFPGPSVEQVRAQILPELRAEIARSAASTNPPALTRDDLDRLLTAYATAQQTDREQELRELYAAIAKVDRQRATDYATLRRGMETVAVVTDATFRETSDRLVELAGYTGKPLRTP